MNKPGPNYSMGNLILGPNSDAAATVLGILYSVAYDIPVIYGTPASVRSYDLSSTENVWSTVAKK